MSNKSLLAHFVELEVCPLPKGCAHLPNDRRAGLYGGSLMWNQGFREASAACPQDDAFAHVMLPRDWRLTNVSDRPDIMLIVDATGTPRYQIEEEDSARCVLTRLT